MKSDTPIRAVVFDLDGTLYTIRRLRLWLTLKLLRDISMLRRLPSARANLRSKSFDSKDALYKALTEEIARKAKRTPEEVATWYHERFMRQFVRILAKRGNIRPGLVPLLESLRSKGAKLAVVSDYGSVPERLEALKIPLDAFNDAFGADEYGVFKPSPKPLVELARKWEITTPELLMVGDREDLDADCARAAGAEFLGIADGPTDNESFVTWPEAVNLLEARLSF